MKSFIKRILPPTWTALIAHNLNKLSRLIIVPIFFKEYPLSGISFLKKVSVRPVDIVVARPDQAYQDLPPQIIQSFKDFNQFEQKEFVAYVDDCLIEPKYGWPLTKSNELIYDCFPYSRQNIIPLPSPFLRNTKKRLEVDRIISFREVFEFGYWHFYTDIIHKNYLLNEMEGIDKEVPILISKDLSTKPQFIFFREQTDVFKGREVIVQNDLLVCATRAYFIKPMPHYPAYYKMTSEAVTKWKGEGAMNRRIFLTRNQSRGRNIINIDGIEAIVKKYDFEFVDADTLTIEQQISIFSETAFLIGIHGAGLSNMMFRHPNSMKVLEIFPFATGRFQMPSHYFLLAGIFGFSYNAVVGSAYINAMKKTFYLNPADLESGIKSLIGK